MIDRITKDEFGTSAPLAQSRLLGAGMGGLTVLSLFDGMSCGRIALEKAKIKVDIYYSSEVDKYSQIVSKANYPDIIRLGDVRNVDVTKIEKIDLLIGGSPCQSFSFAGKRKGMSTKCEIKILNLETYLELKSQDFEFEGQSYLFWEYMRILTEIRAYNPDVLFLLENVEMGKKWERILSEAIGVFGVHINSALVSAQNRKRIYWTNIKTKKVGFFDEVYSDIPQPADRGILLKDILESEVDEKYYLSDKAYSYITDKQRLEKGFTSINTDKALSLMAVGTTNNNGTFIKVDKQLNVKKDQDKASCFTAGAHSGGNHSDMDLIVHNTMPRSSTTGKCGTGHLSRNDGKTYCLDTGNTNAVEIKGCDFRYDEGLRMTGGWKSNYLMKSNRENSLSENPLVMINNSRIRRLTPTEAERLQTVPDGYTDCVSDTQRYRMLGNGWTVDVVAHFFVFLKGALQNENDTSCNRIYFKLI